MLEPCEGRLSRTVLRGLGASNGPWLPDRARKSAAPWSATVSFGEGSHARAAWRVNFSVSPLTDSDFFRERKEPSLKTASEVE